MLDPRETKQQDYVPADLPEVERVELIEQPSTEVSADDFPAADPGANEGISP